MRRSELVGKRSLFFCGLESRVVGWTNRIRFPGERRWIRKVRKEWNLGRQVEEADEMEKNPAYKNRSLLLSWLAKSKIVRSFPQTFIYLEILLLPASKFLQGKETDRVIVGP